LRRSAPLYNRAAGRRRRKERGTRTISRGSDVKKLVRWWNFVPRQILTISDLKSISEERGRRRRGVRLLEHLFVLLRRHGVVARCHGVGALDNNSTTGMKRCMHRVFDTEISSIQSSDLQLPPTAEQILKQFISACSHTQSVDGILVEMVEFDVLVA